jgi:hypothetical protein
MRIRSALLFVTFLVYAVTCVGEELDGSLHFTGGTNKNPNSAPMFSAGLRLDPAFFPRIKSQFFDTGLAYDCVQGHSGARTHCPDSAAHIRADGGSELFRIA